MKNISTPLLLKKIKMTVIVHFTRLPGCERNQPFPAFDCVEKHRI